ncbi:hypothetical protein [Moorena sp. SIO3B2]|uniref:hypothetical protein n=1 Tax=Moorena sp. SIO3B2 TaxID=2607827 RepID=UPI00257B28AF|nr:hypothetical protein [Moorena sp. SIO3B2]
MAVRVAWPFGLLAKRPKGQGCLLWRYAQGIGNSGSPEQRRGKRQEARGKRQEIKNPLYLIRL